VGERTRHLKEVNESLQVEVTKRERHEHCLSLQYEVTRVLADSTATSADVITRILQIVCQSMNWDTGRLWTVDRSAKVLRCTAVWNSVQAEPANSNPPAALAAGNGLPGRVWKTGQAAWITDPTQDGEASSSSPAVKAGLHAAFAFPLQLRGEILGVAEFHSEQIRPPESDLLQIFATLGNLIGQSLERKKLEEQLLQSQKMDAIGRLAGGVAHDFNNILTVIQGYAQILATREDFDQKALDDLKQIIQAAHRASNLTRQLLTFSRKQIIKTVVLDLNKVTSNLTKMLQRIIGEDVVLQCLFSTESPLVRADEDMIGQILMNLAVNARDAMPKGGELDISLSVVELDSTAAQWRSSEAQAGEFVCLSVSDTGSGIAPEDLLRIYEPFFTTKAVGQGTGLGLSTVYGIVKQHGGWIEVSSKLNIGTKFNIFLPRIVAGVAVESGAIESKVVGGTETILLVEDEPPVRTLARVILQRNGYHVLEATSGTDALSVWGQHAAKIDLLLTDIIMPQGVSGRELAQKLRAERPGLKVVFVSGYSPDSMEIGAELNAGTYFLQKPYLPEHLLRSLRQVLDDQTKQLDPKRG
jgi:signal transduction histidine kinase/ActR/RegA family two-component response regulator